MQSASTAAKRHPLRALSDGDLFDHAEQIVVLVVETRRVVARPGDGGLLKEPQLPPRTGGIVASLTVAQAGAAQPIPPRALGGGVQ